MKGLKKITLLPARERVASELRKAIYSGEFRKNQELTLEQVSTSLGVSVTPVREAFQMLSQENLIKLRPNKEAIVVGVSPKFVREHYEARKIIEGSIIDLIKEKNSDISEIEEIFYEAKTSVEAGDISQYSELNQAFHVAIWNAGQNTQLKNFASSLWNGLSMSSVATPEEYAAVSMAEHEELVDALQKRDFALAKELMVEHIERSKSDMLSRFQ